MNVMRCVVVLSWRRSKHTLRLYIFWISIFTAIWNGMNRSNSSGSDAVVIIC